MLQLLEHKRSKGFTLIELLVVLTIIALLLTIAAPRYIQHVDQAKEAALKENLAVLRVAIDQYSADKGVYPSKLEDLVVQKYLRSVPLDTITDRRDTWELKMREPSGDVPEIIDVSSGAGGSAMDGTAFKDW